MNHYDASQLLKTKGERYPRVTGHEVAGVVNEVGADVMVWKQGQRVGVEWHGGHCGQCVSLAVVGISSVASISASRDLVMMAGTRST